MSSDARKFPSYKCHSCGEVHEGAPSFAMKVPCPYLEQTDEVKNTGKVGSDLCYYKDSQGYNYFIRVVLEVPILEVSEPFTWGVWVSLSQKNYERYVETYESPDTSDQYFGWFCNYLPYYENTYALKTQVHPRADGQRPYIVLEESEHELSVDFHQGLSIEKAQRISEICLHKFK